MSIAHHEAAHAVVGLVLGIPIEYATVRPSADCAGHVSWEPMLPAQKHAVCLTYYAGREADLLTRGRWQTWWQWPHRFDYANARPFAAELGGSRALRAQARALVHRHWPQIDRVAHALTQAGTLTGWQIKRLLNPPTCWADVATGL